MMTEIRLRALLSEPWDGSPPQLEIDVPDPAGGDSSWPKNGTIVSVHVWPNSEWRPGHPRPEFNELGWLVGHPVELSLRHRFDEPPTPHDRPTVCAVVDRGKPHYFVVGYGQVEPPEVV